MPQFYARRPPPSTSELRKDKHGATLRPLMSGAVSPKHGFTLNGRTFSWFDRGNWGLIENQKGAKSEFSPLLGKLFIFLAQYPFDPDNARPRHGRRPLRGAPTKPMKLLSGGV